MLNNEQLDLIADVIRPLYQSLEQDVIYDIARRIKKTLTYTRTAELMVMEMEKLGYSPAKIRSEAMKVLRADKEFQKVVEENTLEYKKEVKKLIQKIEKEAERAGNTIVAEAGDMAWIDDMRVWESAGKKLTDDSYLAMLQSAFAEQTAMELKNLTQSTGFKAVSGFESLENAYRRELDKAVLKICTGTFSQEKVLRDVVRELSQSGIRTVDYSSGRTMQIDTAAKLALRTGCHQVSVKIHDQNILNTGENLVYVTEHWGARNEGTGIENHEEWQGKVYFIKPGTDYSKEAKRIKQDRIMDIWYSTGYSPDGAHVSNPLGLHGYNCRHLHMVWFEGSSRLPENNPRPEPKIINGKKYDYYHMTQKCRSMERGIRALKKEMIARERLGLPIDEIKARISEKTREYKAFCDSCDMPTNTSNLRVDSGMVNITKSTAYSEYRQFIDSKELLRIPQIPASTVTEKIRNGEYSIKLKQQEYLKHVEGTVKYNEYLTSRKAKGGNPQSVLTISEKQVQKIIENKAGTGIIKVDKNGNARPQEQITCDEVIGKYYYQGTYIKTNKAVIHYSKRGAHIVPIRGENYD